MAKQLSRHFERAISKTHPDINVFLMQDPKVESESSLSSAEEEPKEGEEVKTSKDGAIKP